MNKFFLLCFFLTNTLIAHGSKEGHSVLMRNNRPVQQSKQQEYDNRITCPVRVAPHYLRHYRSGTPPLRRQNARSEIISTE